MHAVVNCIYFAFFFMGVCGGRLHVVISYFKSVPDPKKLTFLYIVSAKFCWVLWLVKIGDLTHQSLGR